MAIPTARPEAGDEAARLCKLREDDQHWDDGEILDNKEADHDAAGESVGNAGCGEHLEHDGSAGHGYHRAEPDGFVGGHAEPGGRASGGQSAGHQDLDRAANQGDAADRLEVAEREFEAEREEQERHTHFGEEFDVVDLDDSRPCRMGAYEDPGGDVAYHERKTNGAGRKSADQAREDDQDEIGCNAQTCLP
jgi:hypothetical protein